MKLVADAGASKISWALIKDNEIVEFKTPGYNPNIADHNYLRQLLVTGFPADFSTAEVKSVYYYGAGCESDFGKDRVAKSINNFFPALDDLKIMTDIEGAGFAVYGKSKGIIGILGTGAHAGFYNGETVVDSPISIGYLLGDEGGGAYLGKILITKVLREELPSEIREYFFRKFSTDAKGLIKDIYCADYPNRKLASFVPFLKENIQNPVIENIVIEGFILYYKTCLTALKGSYRNYLITIIGGVADAFALQLNSVLLEKGFKNIQIINSPIQYLIERIK